MHRIVFMVMVLLYGCNFASAQSSWTSVNLQPTLGGFNGPSPTGLARDTDTVLVNRNVLGNLESTSSIPLSAFATADSVARLASQAQRDYNRLAQGVALSAAINVMPPNPVIASLSPSGERPTEISQPGRSPSLTG